MDLKLICQPKFHFRFFNFSGEPKAIAPSIHDYEHIPIVTLEEAVEPLVIFIPQIQDMVKLVKEKCQQPKDNLSIDESGSIMLYTMEWLPKEDAFHYIFNRKLHLNDPNELIPWYFYLKLISTSLSKLPKLSRRIFYRGINLDLKNEYFLNRKLFWYEFLSCLSSINAFDKKEFGFVHTDIRTLFIIHSNHAKNISQHSFYKIEHEILLLPGQRFQIVSYKSRDELHVITLKEISYPDSIETSLSTVTRNENLKLFNLLFRKRIKYYENYCEINLRNQKLTDTHMNIITEQAIKNKKCIWLSLQNNQITSQGLCIVADSLKENDSLESLYLSQNFVTNVGVKYLTEILSNNYSNLTLLCLDHNGIKDEGVHYLADMLKENQTLTDLWLSYNDISDYGVQSLANVLRSDNETLMQLYLNGNKLISDYSSNFLVSMFESNRTLNTFWLQDCCLSQEGKIKMSSYSYDNSAMDQRRSNFTNLYVKNFGKDMNETKLCHLFGTYGTITSCKIQTDNNGQSKGFGFVNFERSEMAQHAMMNLNGYVLHDGKQLYVGRFQKKSERQNELLRIREENQHKQSNNLSLFVSNLDPLIDEQLLEVIFTKFGRVTKTHILRNGNQSKGVGFVCFNTIEEATKALNEMNGKWILSKPIYVKLSTNMNSEQSITPSPPTPSISSATITSPPTIRMPYFNTPMMFYLPTLMAPTQSNNYPLSIDPLNLQTQSTKEYSPPPSSMLTSSSTTNTKQ
ncbi:unnamed protein product [Rotaria sordida]|uniref:NAD(P)(+)--arginine ADP-ribosyltransferase n=1 Tax=Rotaria sordida TaxID=392033 RepID=A0A819D7F0_9BILA|nr:unnamed protein product [Rotaria sordida]CAF3829950.1 unnamed protein product [Rotaria sordida]